MDGFLYFKDRLLRAVGLLVFFIAASGAVWGVTVNDETGLLAALADTSSTEIIEIKSDITVTGDLFIDIPGRTISIDNGKTLSCENFILYNGTIKIGNKNSGISTNKDIILLGSDFQSDPEKSYYQSRLSPCNYVGLDLGRTSYSGKITPTSTSCLQAGKNFYANGISMESSRIWYIRIPNITDVTDANEGFAECYNCTVKNAKVIYSDEAVGETDSKVRMSAYDCTDNTGNINWHFNNSNDDYEGEFKILNAYTVRDNVIRVEFNRPIRNKNGEINGENGILSRIKYWNGTEDISFSGIYSDPDCTSSSKILPGDDISDSYPLKSNSNNKIYYFYLKASESDSWNTDATGSSAGNEKSTDRKGNHKESVPCIKIPSFITDESSGLCKSTLTDIYGMRIKDYSTPYTDVLDKTGPVLYSVRTGQENHEQNNGSSESQHSYDAHNFLEFRYSEPVNFGSKTTSLSDIYIPAYENETAKIIENIKVTSKFGALSGTYTTEGPLNFTGLGIIANGLINSANADRSNQYLNALYRKDVYSLRISIAGYTDGTVTDFDGNIYKKWNGYIKDAVQPTGTVDFISTLTEVDEKNGLKRKVNKLVSDVAGNFQEKYSEESENPTVEVNNSQITVNGQKTNVDVLQDETYGDWDIISPALIEAVGNTSGVGTVLDRMEFSSQDDGNNSTKTDGGLRFCTIYSSLNAFSVLSDGISIDYAYGGAPVFKTQETSDSPYFGFTLKNSTLPLTAEIVIKYENGYITDLAGNLLPNSELTSKDKIPPTFNLSIAPVGSKELFVVFSKKLTDTASFKSDLPKCFDFISIDDGGNPTESTNLQIDSSKSAEFIDFGESVSNQFTCVKLFLKRAVTLNDVKNLYLRYNKTDGSLKDSKGNSMERNSAHALSDFAVNVINPLYAYNTAVISSGKTLDNLDTSFAVHDWDQEQTNFGTLVLPSSTDSTLGTDESTVELPQILIIAQSTDGENSSEIENENAPQNVRLYFTANPSQGSVSAQYNSDLNESKRIWLPNLSDYGFSQVFSAISTKENTNYSIVDGSVLENSDDLQLKFTLDSTSYNSWNNEDQITFLFGLTDSSGNPLKIIHSPELNVDSETYNLTASKKFPLFALRLKNSDDVTSFDLWSFRVKSQVGQSGGVSILNNVINPLKGEQTIVEIQNPSNGKVRVFIMTLDGNVVTYLSRGNLSAGNHKFTWNGKNQSGAAVARGMYFVRVIGNGFDETRKVMVVK